MRPYGQIDSLRRHVLPFHLTHTLHHDYGLQGLPQPHSNMPTEDEQFVCLVPAYGALVLQNQMHRTSHSTKAQEGPFIKVIDRSTCHED